MIIACIFIVLVSMTIYNSVIASGIYENDVLGAYINNLYGAKRFSAVPFLSIPVMHFVYAFVLLYVWSHHCLIVRPLSF